MPDAFNTSSVQPTNAFEDAEAPTWYSTVNPVGAGPPLEDVLLVVVPLLLVVVPLLLVVVVPLLLLVELLLVVVVPLVVPRPLLLVLLLVVEPLLLVPT
jgi:hypothetical protein